MKKISLIFLVLLIGLITYNGVLYYKDNFIEENSKKVKFEVFIGEGIKRVSKRLEKEGIIRSSNLFLVQGVIDGKYKTIKYGVHEIDKSDTYKDIYRKFGKGSAETGYNVKITIPEGFNVEKIANRLSERRLIDKDKFLELAKKGEFEYWFLKDIKNQGKYKVEGFLFPQTYFFNEDMSEEDIINIMLKEFSKHVSKYKREYDSKKMYEIITLASIIEKETSIDGEKPLVASVFTNRLRKNMKLQSCATVEYVLDTRKDILSSKDIEVDSRYNTYKYKGLPPTPICNPSIESIDAVVSPQKTEYMFFLSNKEGTKHIFSKTYSEHMENRKKYLEVK